MSVKDDFIRLGDMLAKERDKAHDLWSWLPSEEAARAAHGDYWQEHQPPVGDVMTESAMVLATIAGYSHSKAEVEAWFGCPCRGELDIDAPGTKCGHETAEDIAVRFEKRYGHPLKLEEPKR